MKRKQNVLKNLKTLDLDVKSIQQKKDIKSGV